MFSLSRKTLPTDARDLSNALEDSLRRIVQPIGPMISIEERNYPRLAALRVQLDNATVGDRPPPPLPSVGAVEPALQVENFEINGAPVRVQGAAIQLRCQAREVEISQARDRNGDVLLLLQSAADGTVEVAVSVADLENLVRSGAKTAAAQQGVNVEDVRIELTTRSDRALDLTVHVRAKKLFLSAAVRIRGSAEIDDQLNARLSGLACAGEGTLGTLACGFLNPYLQRFEGREFSLLALPLGDVKLRDVRIATGAQLRVTAQFGR